MRRTGLSASAELLVE